MKKKLKKKKKKIKKNFECQFSKKKRGKVEANKIKLKTSRKTNI